MSARDLLMAASGMSADRLYVDDVFSTYLYTGNGSSQTIDNGIDLAGEGGLVWIKDRTNGAYEHVLADTVRGATKWLATNSTNEQFTTAGTVTSFSSSGFSVGGYTRVNASGDQVTSWTFRKAPKFFDIVTYTGDGVAGRQIPHGLGIAPGMIVVKTTNTTSNWIVYHRGLANTEILALSNTNAKMAVPTVWNSTTPTDAVFTVGTDGSVNAIGNTYVAYLFAHDPSEEGLIQCGGYVGTGAGLSVNLGWEPQFILWKCSSISSGTANTVGATHWHMTDVMRGTTGSSGGAGTLQANTPNAEGTQSYIQPTATGFDIVNSSGASGLDASGQTYIYLAIRRPNEPPTSGTEVFSSVARGTGAGVITAGFPPDLWWDKARDSASPSYMVDRLRGSSKQLSATNTAAETASGFPKFTSTGVDGTAGGVFAPGYFEINHFFRRAPGFFDVVCYTGTGATRVVNHSLGVAPELMIIKARSVANNWCVYSAPVGVGGSLILDSNGAVGTAAAPGTWSGTNPTATSFTVGTTTGVNATSQTFVAYLFATLPGISKVGSYTGNGTSQTINCDFTTGARFVLIKRTDSTGDWLVADTARGIVAASDPRLSLNTTAAEVTTEDWLDPASAGFIVNQVAGSNANVSGGTYLFLAIA